MLNDATGFKHIYICTGLCSGFFILIFMKSLLVSRENHQKDEDNIFTSIHTAGPSLLHRQAKPAFHLMKDSPFPSLPASYLLKAQRIFVNGK